MPRRRAAVRNAFLFISVAALLWALAVEYTGGFVTFIGSVRVSSREPRNSIVISAAALIAAALLSTPAERRRAVPVAWAWLLPRIATLLQFLSHPSPRLAPAIALLAAAVATTVSFREASIYAGGADVYGYVSQAGLWLRGHVRVEEPLMRDPRWTFGPEALVPLGYRATGDGAMVPSYAPGLPLTMAAFQAIGGRDAVFHVVPLLGGVAVWAAYLMGARFGGRAVGAASAVLVASSPTFLFHIMFAMSDVPVAAWWALAFATLLLPGRAAAFAAGLAAGAAILTRPNHALLPAAPGLLLLFSALRERSATGPAAQRLLLFVAAVVPWCIAVGAINNHLYGSPLTSGYGPLSQYFSREHVAPNLRLYPSWIFQSQTPAILLALIAPLLRSRRTPATDSTRAVAAMWLGFAAILFLSLIPYLVFDNWFYLRLALAALVPLIVLMAFAIVDLTSRLPRPLHTLAASLVVAALVWHGWTFAHYHGAFVFREGERKSKAIGEYIAARLPENAALISMQHSGSARYYSGRLTIRYDFIAPPRRLDELVDTLRSLGYHPYVVLEDWERPIFTKLFSGATRLAALDWPPRAWLAHASRVYIYDPADRDAAAAGRTIRPDIVF